MQHGQQEAVAWLVENTRDRERLASNNGERCLLHAAARYGQVSLTAAIYLNSVTFLSPSTVNCAQNVAKCYKAECISVYKWYGARAWTM